MHADRRRVHRNQLDSGHSHDFAALLVYCVQHRAPLARPPTRTPTHPGPTPTHLSRWLARSLVRDRGAVGKTERVGTICTRFGLVPPCVSLPPFGTYGRDGYRPSDCQGGGPHSTVHSIRFERAVGSEREKTETRLQIEWAASQIEPIRCRAGAAE